MTALAKDQTGRPVSGPFEKTKGWLDWYDKPSKPDFLALAGTVDSHCATISASRPGTLMEIAGQIAKLGWHARECDHRPCAPIQAE
jgi:hypothetical protein